MIAVVSAVVGVFTVLRGQSFAGHALTDVATTGGSGAFLLGVEPARPASSAAESSARARWTSSASSGCGAGTWPPASCWARRPGWPRCSSTSTRHASATTGATQQILFGSIFTVAAVDDSRSSSCSSAVRRSVVGVHLPAAAPELGQPRARPPPGASPVRRRRPAVHAGPGRLGRPVLDRHRLDPLDGAAHRPAATALRLTRSVRRGDGWRPASSGSRRPGSASSWPTTATTGILEPGPAGQLLRRRHRLRRATCLGAPVIGRWRAAVGCGRRAGSGSRGDVMFSGFMTNAWVVGTDRGGRGRRRRLLRRPAGRRPSRPMPSRTAPSPVRPAPTRRGQPAGRAGGLRRSWPRSASGRSVGAADPTWPPRWRW